MTIPQPICDACYVASFPLSGEPFRVAGTHRREVPCCVCGTPNRSGIYLAEHPAKAIAPAPRRRVRA